MLILEDLVAEIWNMSSSPMYTYSYVKKFPAKIVQQIIAEYSKFNQWQNSLSTVNYVIGQRRRHVGCFLDIGDIFDNIVLACECL